MKGHKDTPICGITKLECAFEIKAKIWEIDFLDKLKGVDDARQNCNCLPSCTSINYNIETSSVKFDFDKYLRTQNTGEINL